MDRSAAPAQRPHTGPKVISQKERVNIALPLSMIRAEGTTAMRAGDWISLAGMVISVIGFGVVIRELIRIANAREAAPVMSGSASPAGQVPPGQPAVDERAFSGADGSR